MERIIFLSPHFDDAVLSCPGVIQKLVAQRKEVFIVTVFTDSSEDQQTLYQQRFEEDERACTVLNAQNLRLNFLDAPYRINSSGVLFQDMNAEQSTLEELVKALKKICNEMSPCQIYAPLGVGWHIDHLLVFEAARVTFNPSQLIFYEDAPYKWVRHQTDLRLCHQSEETIQIYCDDFLRAQYVRSFLSHWSREYVESLVKGNNAPKISICLELFSKVHLDAKELQIAELAISSYESQASILLSFNSKIDVPERYYQIFNEQERP